jgi:hypothetical protein
MAVPEAIRNGDLASVELLREAALAAAQAAGQALTPDEAVAETLAEEPGSAREAISAPFAADGPTPREGAAPR